MIGTSFVIISATATSGGGSAAAVCYPFSQAHTSMNSRHIRMHTEHSGTSREERFWSSERFMIFLSSKEINKTALLFATASPTGGWGSSPGMSTGSAEFHDTGFATMPESCGVSFIRR
jgi:hypothetical protein